MSQKKEWEFGYLFRWMSQLKSRMLTNSQEQETISLFILNLIFLNYKNGGRACRQVEENLEKIVSRTYETCDRFETSIFNLHYMCGSCGYMECLHCYKKRMPKTTQKSCKHSSSKFSLVELIPARALQFLQEQVPLNLENFRRRSTDEHNHMFFPVNYNS